MRRETRSVYKELYFCFPLIFWKQCISCKKEFVRERGWRALIGPFGMSSGGRWAYLCEKCAPTFGEANDYFVNDKWIPPKPEARPAPPPNAL